MEYQKDKPTFFARIKPFLIVLGFVLSICLGTYGSVVFNTPVGDKITSIPQLSFIGNLPRPDINFEFDLLVFLNDGVEELKEKIARKVTGKEPLITQTKRAKGKKGKSKSKKEKKEEHKINPEKIVTLRLKNGSAISGELIGESKLAYVLWWQGGQVVFDAKEVESVERKKTLKDPNAVEIQFKDSGSQLGDWSSHKNDVVIKLVKGAMVDQPITSVNKNQVTIRENLEGGGNIEQDIDRSKIDYLIFRPVESPKNKTIEDNLRKQFPKMKFHKEGNFTIVTDVYETEVLEYKNILHRNSTEVYLNFFPILKNRKQSVQNYVVIFDNKVEFIDHSVAEGIPGWLALGYFKPDDQVLYLFNAQGDSFRKITTQRLRHESTHQILASWGIQKIMVSDVGGEPSKQDLVEKKNRFEKEFPEMTAANPWHVEGVAAYFETNPAGERNDPWLYRFQKMMHENALYPTEQLTVYKIGSFPGVYPDAMINAYAQSWAFVTFLMKQYPDQFLNYLVRVSEQTPKDNEEVQWLAHALGKDIRIVEAEFLEFMKKYEAVEGSDGQHSNKILEIFTSHT